MRYNIFNKAHLPLKRALIESCVLLDKLRNQERISASEVLKKVDEVLYLYSEQITYEALHILPFVFEYEPSVCSNYTVEHNSISILAGNLKPLLQSYFQQQKREDQLKVMGLISESYNEFLLANFNHMDDEEAVLNEILWRYYSDEVLTQIEETMDILPHLVRSKKQKKGFSIATAA
jgi:hypothetical protein